MNASSISSWYLGLCPTGGWRWHICPLFIDQMNSNPTELSKLTGVEFDPRILLKSRGLSSCLIRVSRLEMYLNIKKISSEYANFTSVLSLYV
jgi:hypothetical protein